MKKVIVLCGGTGFLGRAIIEKYINNGWRVLVPTRGTRERAKDSLIAHGINRVVLQAYINNGDLSFATEVNLCEVKWKEKQAWNEMLHESNVLPSDVSRLVNLISDTSGDKEKIWQSNIGPIEAILNIVNELKSKNRGFIFCNMGTAAENNYDKIPPPYEASKIVARNIILRSGLCDYHFLAHYVKGRGEVKMRKVAPRLWKTLFYSYRWLFNFFVSIVDVDDLADIIYYTLEKIHFLKSKEMNRSTNIVLMTNGEIIFGEMIKYLLPIDQRLVPKQMIPKWFDRFFLKSYSTIVSYVYSNDQLKRRYAKFASFGSQKNIVSTSFISISEIQAKYNDKKNYSAVTLDQYKFVFQEKGQLIYVMKERSSDELSHIIQYGR